MATAERPQSIDAGERFTIEAELGRGGMGVVYRAFDHVRRQRVAYKSLRRIDAAMLYRFKQEFRALADLVHGNLVTLYELHCDHDDWFFTMELVDGDDFLEFVRPHGHLLGDRTGRLAEPLPELSLSRLSPGAGVQELRIHDVSTLVNDDASVTMSTQQASSETSNCPPSARRQARRKAVAEAAVDLARLRASFVQLVDAVAALHGYGMLHRDLKPSNVLVDRGGRVVVCDFGLIAHLGNGPSAGREVVGTPAYMAPEQARGAPGEASDWYSVGVMLYEALTGRLPFEGTALEIVRRKQSGSPVPPAALVPDVDPELATLAMRLLAPAPDERPGLTEIRAALTAERPATAPTAASPTVFVGRRAQLDALHEAFDAARAGRTVAALVRGASGMGKSATVRRFLGELGERGEVMILQGRCYERESVPYKALDALVDELSGQLFELEDEEVRSLRPGATAVAALLRLFPVLSRVPAIAAVAADVDTVQDPQALRRQAFTALRQLLAAIAEKRQLVLYIDDLQWGDVDSTPFFVELLHDADAGGLLLIASYRIEEEQRSPILRVLLERRGLADGGDLRRIDIEPFDAEETRALVAAIAGAGCDATDARIEQLTREAGGSPLFVAELAQRLDEQGELALSSGVSLDEFLAGRIADLPEGARAMLTAAAVAGRPVDVSIVARAAEVQDESQTLALLTARRFIRSAEVGGRECVETYHDRVRETAVAQLDERDARRIHRRLARAIESAGGTDVLALVEHWLGAGDHDKASSYALRAAELAEEAAAFDRAAHHYRLVLQLGELDRHTRARLTERLATALFNAGSLPDAATTYLESAAQTDDRLTAIELERRAIQCLLCSGQLDEGLELARKALRAVGMRMPKSPLRALLRVLAYRAWLKLRGEIRENQRPLEEIDPEELLRIDVAYSVSIGLSFLNPLLAISLQVRQVVWAMRAGEPHRVVLGRIVEIGFRSTAGGSVKQEVDEIIASTLQLARERTSGPYVGAVSAAGGLASFMVGDFVACHERTTRGIALMNDNPGQLRWYLDMAYAYQLSAQLYLGELRVFAETVSSLLRDAQDRGDTYLVNVLRSWRGNVAWLVLDRPDEARAQLDAVLSGRRESGSFHIQNYFELSSACRIELYAGRHQEAWHMLEDGWRRMKKGFVLRVQSLRIEGHSLRARCAVALAAQVEGKQRKHLLREARRSILAMRGEHMAWADALAMVADACVQASEGDREAAVRAFEDARTRCDQTHMRCIAQIARMRAGQLRGDADGAREAETARACLRAESVVDPDAFARIYAPVDSVATAQPPRP